MHSYLYLNGLRFHYLNHGGEGRPVVLLHGLASNARIWDLVAPRLAQRFRVLALDQRGHGLSDPAVDGFEFPAIVGDLRAFLDALALERPLLVGHSWGAHTVLEYAAKHPAGPGAPAGIVLVDGSIGDMNAMPGVTWERAEPMLTPPDLDGMPRVQFLQRLKGWLGELTSVQTVDIAMANFLVTPEDTVRRRLPIAQHMRVARAIFEHKPSTLFPRLRCPALLCPAVPPAPRDERFAMFLALNRTGAALAEQANPRVRTVWFEDTVHDVPLHRPAELARAVLDFSQSIST